MKIFMPSHPDGTRGRTCPGFEVKCNVLHVRPLKDGVSLTIECPSCQRMVQPTILDAQALPVLL